MPRFFNAVMAFIVTFFTETANANSGDGISSICDTAAHMAAGKFEIPVDVLLALTRTETGRSGKNGLMPWPWTINMEGTGFWFDNRDDALSFALERQQNGAISFDIGCFQINHKWHGGFFDSVEDMFDPSLNALYAARFLEQLFLEFGSWSAAAGAFHSRTPLRAQSYAARFDRIRMNVNTDSPETNALKAPPLGIFDRRGKLGLTTASLTPLVAGGQPNLGSLFPNTRISVGNGSNLDIQNQGS